MKWQARARGVPSPAEAPVPAKSPSGGGTGGRGRCRRRRADECSSAGSRPGHVPGAFTTPWQPSRPSSRPVSTRGTYGSPGALRLVSYIEGPDWKQGSKQVPPGYLDCPAIDACYLLAQTVLTTVGPSPTITTPSISQATVGPAGLRWRCRPVSSSPPPFRARAPWPASASATRATRTNWSLPLSGGHRWTVSPLRAPADVMSLSCSSVSRCSLVTESSYLVPGNPQQVRFDHRWGRPLVHPQLRSPPVHLARCRAPAPGIASSSPATLATGAATTSGLGAGAALLTTDGGRGWSRSAIARAAPAPHWHPQSLATSAFWPAATGRTAFSLAATPSPIALLGLTSLPRELPGRWLRAP